MDTAAAKNGFHVSSCSKIYIYLILVYWHLNSFFRFILMYFYVYTYNYYLKTYKHLYEHSTKILMIEKIS